MKLFDVAKVGLFLDNITHGTETRKGDEVKIVTLTLRVAPFDVKLAHAVGSLVRNTLFKLSGGSEAHPHLKRVEFALGCPRQLLQVYASPDTSKASIAFDQVKIASVLARVDKDVTGYAFVIKGSVGPLGKTELAYIEDWRLGQRFVTFDVAEPGMFSDDEDAEDEDEEAPSPKTRPAPMFGDDDGARH